VNQQAQDVATVRVWLPLPPNEVGPNGRAHWAKKATSVRELRAYAYVETRVALVDSDYCPTHMFDDWQPWPAAVMHIQWRCAGVAPDSDNIVARCKAYRDAAADAGLVANDRDVSIGNVTIEKVRRLQQEVVITFERKEAA
jgi:hypothetical protein